MSEQELLEQLRAGMDTTPLHTGDLPPLDLYMDQVLAMLEERFQSGARQPGLGIVVDDGLGDGFLPRLPGSGLKTLLQHCQ